MLLGLQFATPGKAISIEVIDVVRIKAGKYFEHWGITTLPELLAQLSKQ